LEKLDIHLDIARTFVDEILEYHLEFYLGIRDEGDGGDFEGDPSDDEDAGDDSSSDDAPKKGKKHK